MEENILKESTQEIKKQELKQGKENKKTEGTKKIIQEIKIKIINGYNVEEIKVALDEKLSQNEIENICDKYKDLALLAKGMPTGKLAEIRVEKNKNETEEEYKKRVRVCQIKYAEVIRKNNLKEKIKAKKIEIKSRLKEGQTPEQILQDKELNVCMEIIEYIEKMQKEKNKKRSYTSKACTSVKKATTVNSKKISKVELLKQNYKKIYEDGSSEELDKNKKNIDTKKVDKQISVIGKRLEGAKGRDKDSRNLARTLTYYINQKIDSTEDLEELQHLKKRFTKQFRDEFRSIDIIIQKLDKKILEQQRKNTIDKIRTEVPDKIHSLIKDLVRGEINIQLAQKIIEEEAKNRVNNSPKNSFALTEEQQKRQIIILIRENLKNNFEKYPIENPENTIEQLNKLSGQENPISVDAVVKNLVKRKEFEKSKEICSKYTEIYQSKGNQMDIKAITSLSRYIKNEELGDLILRAIYTKSDKQLESQEEFWKTIEKGIESKRIKLSAIPLGKSQSGKYIFLKDVWPDDDKKVIYR